MIAMARELWLVVRFDAFMAGLCGLLAWLCFYLYARRKRRLYQFFAWGFVVIGALGCIRGIFAAFGFVY
jgi:hypothetical protein